MKAEKPSRVSQGSKRKLDALCESELTHDFLNTSMPTLARIKDKKVFRTAFNK